MPTAYIALGSNLDDPRHQLLEAIRRMRIAGLQVYSIAPFVETHPVGFASEHLFLNSVVAVHTVATPEELLAQLQEIEREMGRRHKSHDGIYSDRVIDLDILIYDQRVVTTPELTIPHPRMCERAFVLQPLSYIAPELTIPTTGTTVDQLLGAQPA
ncbi:2-amino-4-hydroxy-6-hydroxymethyldihydropteridine diphosphokinase [uncultured Porphyromonas sp.]|uniref:2-amino-4-hydroxy-6- hydroxymethyldihydropteridine diphosphokinase n=1 Tax=uncultured Porphyromonas sp. TaxID=159274 RepID=UPI0026376F3F|nr:2-amino-4-hydroxy-6-hydroxymethyldihydropteridine diphosphokinase [uncultured Porphyromonas sp.]